MATTEELVKKAFDEIGDQISSSTRELLNSIPRLERRVRELERAEKTDISIEDDVQTDDSRIETAEDRNGARPDDEKNTVYTDRIKTARNKNTRAKDAEE